MKKLVLAAAVALPLALAHTATATPTTPTLAKSKCQKARDRGEPCEMVFDKGDTLDGTAPNPDGEDVLVPRNSFFGKLIRLRWDFHPEIIASAEDL
jgi:hypothetical protein